MRKIVILIWITGVVFAEAGGACGISGELKHIARQIKKNELKEYDDLKRNIKGIKGRCIYRVGFREGRYDWSMLLIFHPKKVKGLFWFLPHDNENSAFDSTHICCSKIRGWRTVCTGRRDNIRATAPQGELFIAVGPPLLVLLIRVWLCKWPEEAAATPAEKPS